MNYNRKILLKNAGAWLITAVCLFVFIISPQEVSAQKRGQQKKNKKSIVQKSSRQKNSLQRKSQSLKKQSSNNQSQNSSVEASRRELLKLQSQIKSTRSEIKNLSKKETNTLQKLTIHEKHSTQLHRHINLLENDVAVLKDSINIAKRNEQILQSRLSKLQQEYAKIAQEFYKYGNTSSDELIATGRPSDTEIRRNAYMKALTQQLNERVHQMAEVKDSIARQKEVLKTHTLEQNRVLKTKAAEQNELGRSIAEKKKALDAIRSDKQMLQQELVKKEQSARQIGGIINRLIADEMRKREQRRKDVTRKREERPSQRNSERNALKGESLKKESTKGESPDIASNERGSLKTTEDRTEEIPDYSRSSFKTNSLAWPVGGRRILRGFGQYRNPSTNTITDNPGVDISASRGSGVQSVSNGVVSLLHWLPGYGSLVIIDHENGFRSVYANLSSVSVSEGQRVSGGGMIGRSGESVDGEFLHFELWRERQRLNPVSWLR